MIKTQVQIPDELFERAKQVAAAKEWSFAEVVRRGLEYMTRVNPPNRVSGDRWELPEPVDLELTEDPFAHSDWREEANLTTAGSKVIAERLREDAARYEAGA